MRAAVVAVVTLLAVDAAAQETYPPVTDRDFALDLTVGTVLGSIRTIGMGGASVAMVEQASGMGANPAAPAVRKATSNDWWDWDAGLDWINPDFGTDFDNNGQSDDGGHAAIATIGFALGLNHAGVGIDLTDASRNVNGLRVSATTARLLLAYAFPGDVITVGLGLRGGVLGLTRESDMKELASAVSWSGTAGVLWRPRDLDVRIGGSVSLPIEARADDCDDCGLIVPESVRLPWEASVGAAWRFGPTRWNQQIQGRWRDEREVTVATDVVVTGAMADTYGLQRYAGGELQASGRSPTVSVRAGAEAEVIPGWLRLRAGSYWEPRRMEGVHGRLHGTFGIAGRLFSINWWIIHCRVRASFTIDGARDYINGGVALGFW